MFNSILAAYDGSTPARAAAGLAAACARRWNAKLTLCYALDAARLLVPATSPAPAFDILKTFRRQAADLLVEQLAECRKSGIDAETILRDESAGEGILNGASQAKADLIAMGTHGRSGVDRAFLGSVAEEVLRHSLLPVLTVRADDVTATPFKDIVVAIDGSACAARALEIAGEIARADGSTLYLLHVVAHGASQEQSLKGHDALQASAKRARANGATAYLYDAIGDAGSEICTFAERMKAQLVLTGSHGRSGLVRAFLGSVAESAVRHAPCPVLVAKVN